MVDRFHVWIIWPVTERNEKVLLLWVSIECALLKKFKILRVRVSIRIIC